MSQSIPGKPPAWHPFSQRAGQLGLYVFFLFFQLNATVSYVGLGLMTLVFAVQHREWRPLLRRTPAAWLYLALALSILLYSAWATHEFPASAQDQKTALVNWMHWLFFIPVAWSVSKESTHRVRLLLILAAGVMVRILIHADWGNLGNLFAWPRTGFGYSEIVTALICGVAALGFLLLPPRLAQGQTRCLPIVFWLAGLAVFLESMFLTQTRSAWLAALMVFPVALVARYWDWLKGSAFKSFHGLALLALVFLAAGLFIEKNAGLYHTRMQTEPETVENLMQGNAQIPPTLSIGIRLELWRIGLGKFMERPWLGWGPGTTRLLMEQATTDRLISSHAHLHSLYLEWLVRFGLLGGLLFGGLTAAFLKGIRQAYRNGLIPWDYTCFLFAGWAFTAIYMVFDFQIFKYVWRNYCVIWAALSYAVQLGNTLTPGPSPAHGGGEQSPSPLRGEGFAGGEDI